MTKDTPISAVDKPVDKPVDKVVDKVVDNSETTFLGGAPNCFVYVSKSYGGGKGTTPPVRWSYVGKKTMTK